MRFSSVTRHVILALALATLLTAFFYVHEDLPTVIRAPSSLLLTGVAVASGVSHYAGGGDVYGVPWRVLVANIVTSALFLWLAYIIRRRYHGRIGRSRK